MTMAAAIERRMAEAQAWNKASRLARVDIVHSMGQAEAVWRELERPQQFSTPYQRLDFLGPWQRQVGERQNLLPFIVVAYDSDHRPLLLLPLVLKQEFGVRTACFMGGKHATFNMALWDKDFAANLTVVDLDALLTALRSKAAADVLALTRQPLCWREITNPMGLLPNQASANDCPLMTMVPGAPPATRISGSFRGRLRGKERKLQALPGYRYYLASNDADIKRLLEAFFRLKPLRMAERKLPNVFAEPGIEEFIRDACMTPVVDGGRAIEIHALECDAEVIAIFAGVADGYRFSMMFNTYTMSANARHSPGLVLMRNIIDHYAERGYFSLDLGVGSDDYKRLFCKDGEPIFDCFVPLSPRGHIAAAGMSVANHAKRWIKHTPTLFQATQKLRGALN